MYRGPAMRRHDRRVPPLRQGPRRAALCARARRCYTRSRRDVPMSRALVLSLMGAGLLAATLAGGCGGGGEGAGGSGGHGGATSSTVTHSTTTVTTTGTGGAPGNHTFDTAAPLDYGSPLDGDLSPACAVD